MLKTIKLNYKNQEINIEYFHIDNNSENTILFLHGLGASKDDFFETANNKPFQYFNLVGIDFPGTNSSSYIEKLNILDLVEITNLFIEELDFKNIILVGHSMGGVVGLKCTDKFTSKVKCFVNIEGNLIKKDSSFSGYISSLRYEKFVEEFGDNKSMYDLSFSLVEESKTGDLLNKFINLNLPKLYIYGDKSDIFCLYTLVNNGINLSCISNSGHHPFSENPEEFNLVLHQFIKNNLKIL